MGEADGFSGVLFLSAVWGKYVLKQLSALTPRRPIVIIRRIRGKTYHRSNIEDHCVDSTHPKNLDCFLGYGNIMVRENLLNVAFVSTASFYPVRLVSYYFFECIV
jgi:hypothetical protein